MTVRTQPQFGFPGGPLSPPWQVAAADVPVARDPLTHAPAPTQAAIDEPLQVDQAPETADVHVLSTARPARRAFALRGAPLLVGAAACVALLTADVSAAATVALLGGVVLALWAVLVLIAAFVRPTEVQLNGTFIGVRHPFGQYSWCNLSHVQAVRPVSYPAFRPRSSNHPVTAAILWTTAPRQGGMSRIVSFVATRNRQIPLISTHSTEPPTMQSGQLYPFVVPIAELDNPTVVLDALDTVEPFRFTVSDR